MEVQRTGIILNTEHYDACVAFYQNVLSLRVMFDRREGDFALTCLAFGGSYLMIETEGIARPEGKTPAESAHKLRLNVADLKQVEQHLQALGVEYQRLDRDWGSTINLHDPDGNRIGIRDESSFHP
ncbi:VOC family protein [Halomonas cupida]|uniref:VOC family protein n=1 Tax=Halomonas cupida TaxID=44933 RepID=UPI003A8E9BCE